MNVIILSVIVVVLLIALLAVSYQYRTQKHEIRNIEKELAEYLSNQKKDKILMLSEQASVQKLLVQINQLIAREGELERRQKSQDESNRRMLSNISHDLKTPLTVILGYAEMLQNEAGEMADDSRQKIEKIQNKAQDVLVMIEEFFDVVKIEAGDFSLKPEAIDLCEVCREEILNYYQLIEQTKIKMEIDISEEAILIEGDRIALKRIFSNLVENAIKYGADGRYLKVRVYQEEGHKYIQVIDHGKGIVEDHQDKIFERLFTLEDSRNKKYQGSGIGLTVTKRLVEAMDGKLTLKSIPYQETVFTVEF